MGRVVSFPFFEVGWLEEDELDDDIFRRLRIGWPLEMEFELVGALGEGEEVFFDC